jgi:hypothetical protein
VQLPAPHEDMTPLEVGVRLLRRASTTSCQCVEYELKDTYIDRVLDVFSAITEEFCAENLRSCIPIYDEKDVSQSDMILFSPQASMEETSASSLSTQDNRRMEVPNRAVNTNGKRSSFLSVPVITNLIFLRSLPAGSKQCGWEGGKRLGGKTCGRRSCGYAVPVCKRRPAFRSRAVVEYARAPGRRQ